MSLAGEDGAATDLEETVATGGHFRIVADRAVSDVLLLHRLVKLKEKSTAPAGGVVEATGDSWEQLSRSAEPGCSL